VDLLNDDFRSYRILSLRIAANRIRELASYPFIEFVQPAPKGDQPFLYNSRYGSKANQLNASIADGGKGLNGAGVVVGVGDNADVQSHVDFADRLINRSFLNAAGHGTHVTGIVGGAGNINQLYRGYASKATIISQTYSGILTNAAAYVQDYGMVITNNSYGDVVDCGLYGTYDLQSRIMDEMAYQLPQLTNVFAAGNQGGETCAPFAFSYRTVVGGYQSAKNVIAVGATTDSGAIAYLSSRGPVRDGRIKPEITAHGEFVASTWPVNGYSYNNGTSMASPAVAGGLALLYERYRQLHGGANPANGLMKALLCNGATDRGAPGPDFQYGFGWMNLLRSLDIMEGNHYFIANATPGSTTNHTITIPANTAQVKVMLYWNDPAASVLSPQTLVNDLDLTVTDPSSTVVLPRILDTAVANVGNVATNGADHINNI
jgi:subtilisin family serine protease